MFENILMIIVFAIIIVVVLWLMRLRMRFSLNHSLRVERKRVPKLSAEALQKRISQAEKVHNSKILNGFIGLFYAQGYAEYKEELMQLYREELAKRDRFA